MWWTSVRHSAESAIQKLLPRKLPPSLSGNPGNLYDVISRAPGGGVGRKVHQLRWNDKQIGNSYWLVTRSKFKCEGRHGKAWGLLYWKGKSRRSIGLLAGADFSTNPSDKLVSPREERIRGALKYKWNEGPSQANPKAPSESVSTCTCVSIPDTLSQGVAPVTRSATPGITGSLLPNI